MKVVSKLFGVIGAILVSYYFSFMLLSYIELYGNNYRLIKTPVYSKIFDVAIIAFIGFAFIIAGSLGLKKYNPLLIRKATAILIDGLILISFLYLCQKIFVISPENNSKYGFELVYPYELFKVRIFSIVIYFLIFYFIGEMNYGTIGKQTMKLFSAQNDGDKISFITALKKTMLYCMPFLAMVVALYIFSDFNFRESDSIILLRIFCFLFYSINLSALFLTKDSKTITEILTQTAVFENSPNSPSDNLD
jgi:uncharacterized RDD family membrane protein YckC